MKIALVTTTISVPVVLRLYRRCAPAVRFFIAGDRKTPHDDLMALCEELGNAEYTAPTAQGTWCCSDPIGFDCVQRRNIATLEALRWGADVIVSIDDDNIPMHRMYFQEFNYSLIGHFYPGAPSSFSGLRVSDRSSSWFDPAPPHRGFPIGQQSNPVFEAVVDAKVGVAAGGILGDPDIHAVDRIRSRPFTHSLSELWNAGFVVDPKIWTVFNSQNTAVIRELIPAFFMFPHVGRYDDIYASLLMQRIMRERNLHVHFGCPFVFQQRHKHDVLTDLRQEIDGMEKIDHFAYFMDCLSFGPDTPVTLMVEAVFSHREMSAFFPPRTIEAGLAWLEDCREVMK